MDELQVQALIAPDPWVGRVYFDTVLDPTIIVCMILSEPDSYGFVSIVSFDSEDDNKEFTREPARHFNDEPLYYVRVV